MADKSLLAACRNWIHGPSHVCCLAPIKEAFERPVQESRKRAADLRQAARLTRMSWLKPKTNMLAHNISKVSTPVPCPIINIPRKTSLNSMQNFSRILLAGKQASRRINNGKNTGSFGGRTKRNPPCSYAEINVTALLHSESLIMWLANRRTFSGETPGWGWSEELLIHPESCGEASASGWR